MKRRRTHTASRISTWIVVWVVLTCGPVAPTPQPSATGAALQRARRQRVKASVTPELRRAMQDLQRDQSTSSFDTCTLSIDKSHSYADFVIGEDDLAVLAKHRVAYQVLERDHLAILSARLLSGPSAPRSSVSSLDVVDRTPFSPHTLSTSNFATGSVSGFFTLAEAQDALVTLVQRYPKFVRAYDVIGTSRQGRPIYVLTISSQSGNTRNNPAVLYTSLHHAREPQSFATVLYYMLYLCEQATAGNNEILQLLDSRVLHFVPIVNPDGYHYNMNHPDPSERYQRKNMADVCVNEGWGQQGVDLNRNYGYKWNLDDDGSSGRQCSEVYRGDRAFSEPETAAIRDFLKGTKGQSITMALNYHAYGNMVLYPYGYAFSAYPPEKHHDLMKKQVDIMARDNGYTTGTGWEVLYVTNGASDDYMYHEHDIFAMTVEVGNGNDAFYPVKHRITLLAKDNVRLMTDTAWMAGSFLTVQVHQWQQTATSLVAVVRLSNLGRRSTTSSMNFTATTTGKIRVNANGGDTTFSAPVPAIASNEYYDVRLDYLLSDIRSASRLLRELSTTSDPTSPSLSIQLAVSLDIDNGYSRSYDLSFTGKLCATSCSGPGAAPCDFATGACAITATPATSMPVATQEPSTTDDPHNVTHTGRGSRTTFIVALVVAATVVTACSAAVVLGYYRRRKARADSIVVQPSQADPPPRLSRDPSNRASPRTSEGSAHAHHAPSFNDVSSAV